MGSKAHEMRADWILPTVVESIQAEGRTPEAIFTLPAVEITHGGNTYTATVGVYPPGNGEIPAGENDSEWGFMATRDDHHARPDDVGIWQRAMWGSFAPTQMDVLPETWRKDLMGADPLMWGE